MDRCQPPIDSSTESRSKAMATAGTLQNLSRSAKEKLRSSSSLASSSSCRMVVTDRVGERLRFSRTGRIMTDQKDTTTIDNGGQSPAGAMTGSGLHLHPPRYRIGQTAPAAYRSSKGERPLISSCGSSNITTTMFLLAIVVSSTLFQYAMDAMPHFPPSMVSAYVLPSNNRQISFRSSFATSTARKGNTKSQQNQQRLHTTFSSSSCHSNGQQYRSIGVMMMMIIPSSSVYFSTSVTSSLRTAPPPTLTLSSQRKEATTKLFMSSSETVKGRKTSETDKREWKAIVLALQIYKAAYGDLKVPKKFVVPSMKPWPEISWDLKLGQKVASIRETGLYIGSNEKRRAQLDQLGFVWRARAPPSDARDTADGVPFKQVYDALVAYRENIKPTGQLNIPLDFTVPDSEPWPENTRGLPLGLTVDALKSQSFLEKNPEAEKKLQEIGVLESSTSAQENMSANDKRFQAIYDALLRYKEIYGDLLVPQAFVIPEDSQDFPENTWGIRLGARVNNIRTQGSYVNNNSEREEMLTEIGFVWTPPQKESKSKRGRRSLDEIDREEREVLEALSSSAHSSDSEDPSPTEDDDEDIESFLSSFDFSESGEDDDDDSSVSPKGLTWGLEAQDDDDGAAETDSDDASMNAGPDEDWEEPMNLGQSLAAAKERAVAAGIVEDNDTKRPTKRKREPEMPWYNDDFGDDFVFEDVVEALTLYKQFYGSFANLTNAEYTIPIRGDSDLEYDEFDALSAELMSMADGLSSAEMEAARFVEDPNSMTNEQLEAEITKMEEAMLGPKQQQSQLQWPEHLEGMRLGNIVRRIREGSLEVKHLPERKAQLDAIDFDWGDPRRFLDVPFEKAVCAMQAYYIVRGDMFVPFDFIMPDEDPWPSALAGYELGKAVKRIRQLQNFFEVFHEEKLYVLRMIDFVWFPTLALPIDPNEGEMTPDRLLLVGMGHPDFQQIRTGPRERADPTRPDFLGADPRQWWRVWRNWEYTTDIAAQDGIFDDAHRLRKKGDLALAEEHEELYGPGLYGQIISLTQDLSERDIIQDDDEKDNLADVIADYIYQAKKCIDFDREDTMTLVQYLTTARQRHDIEDREIEIIDEDENEEDVYESDLEAEAERISKEVSSGLAFEEEAVDDDEDIKEGDDSEDDDEYEYEYEWEYDSEFEEELGLETANIEEEQMES